MTNILTMANAERLFIVTIDDAQQFIPLDANPIMLIANWIISILTLGLIIIIVPGYYIMLSKNKDMYWKLLSKKAEISISALEKTSSNVSQKNHLLMQLLKRKVIDKLITYVSLLFAFIGEHFLYIQTRESVIFVTMQCTMILFTEINF